MKTIKSILPEIVFLAGNISVVVGMAIFMHWAVALIYGGAVLMLISNYLIELMFRGAADE